MQIMSIAASGMAAAARRFDASAVQTVNAAGSGQDDAMVEGVVGQVQAETAFSASVSVAKSADEMLGRLLDIQA